MKIISTALALVFILSCGKTASSKRSTSKASTPDLFLTSSGYEAIVKCSARSLKMSNESLVVLVQKNTTTGNYSMKTSLVAIAQSVTGYSSSERLLRSSTVSITTLTPSGIQEIRNLDIALKVVNKTGDGFTTHHPLLATYEPVQKILILYRNGTPSKTLDCTSETYIENDS